MPFIDLREHIGVWERCGNTSFWRMVNWRETVHSFTRHLFLNPVDGVMIYAQDYPQAGGRALEVTVRDGRLAAGEDVQEACTRTQPWVCKVLTVFLTDIMLVRIGLIRGFTPLSFFIKRYKDQNKHFVETGEGYQSPGKDELLAATKAVLGTLEGKSIALRKVILKEEWDEFLGEYGILEC